MDAKDAQKQLGAALKAGLLYVITNEHACGGGIHPAVGPFDPKKCAAFEYPKRDPRHFVCHQVTALEGPDHRGLMQALTAEGDRTLGEPEALLPKLLEYSTAQA